MSSTMPALFRPYVFTRATDDETHRPRADVLYEHQMKTRANVDRAKSDSGTPAVCSASLSERQMQDIARALSEPRRFQILQQIASDACSACSDLRASFPITAPTLSHHLKELEQAGLILTSKRGKFVDLHFRRDVWRAYLAQLSQL